MLRGCSCIRSACVHVYELVCVCVFVYLCKPEGKHACCSLSAIHLGFWSRKAAQDFPELHLPLFPSTKTAVPFTKPDLLQGPWGSSSGPHICKASTWFTELSPQLPPPFLFLFLFSFLDSFITADSILSFFFFCNSKLWPDVYKMYWIISATLLLGSALHHTVAVLTGRFLLCLQVWRLLNIFFVRFLG